MAFSEIGFMREEQSMQVSFPHIADFRILRKASFADKVSNWIG
jgi:hypothetical protein